MHCSPFASRSGTHDHLAGAVQLQAAVGEVVGRANTRRPDFERGGDALAAVEFVTVGIGSDDLRSRTHVHAERAQLRGGRQRNRFGKCAEDARPAFEEGDAQSRADVTAAVRSRQLDHAAQFGSQLHPGRAAADDGDADIAALSEAAHHVRANARVERIGLIVTVDEVTVFDDATCAKVIGPAADGQDQNVKSNSRVPATSSPAASSGARRMRRAARSIALSCPGMYSKWCARACATYCTCCS